MILIGFAGLGFACISAGRHRVVELRDGVCERSDNAVLSGAGVIAI
jgi:hypothetical protein